MKNFIKKILGRILNSAGSKKLTSFFYVTLYKFPRRVRAAWSILFSKKEESWVLIRIPTIKDLSGILYDSNFELDLKYEGLRPYVIDLLIKRMEGNIDETEFILKKAEFEARSEHFNKTGEVL